MKGEKWLPSRGNVGKYATPMEHLGMKSRLVLKKTLLIKRKKQKDFHCQGCTISRQF